MTGQAPVCGGGRGSGTDDRSTMRPVGRVYMYVSVGRVYVSVWATLGALLLLLIARVASQSYGQQPAEPHDDKYCYQCAYSPPKTYYVQRRPRPAPHEAYPQQRRPHLSPAQSQQRRYPGHRHQLPNNASPHYYNHRNRHGYQHQTSASGYSYQDDGYRQSNHDNGYRNNRYGRQGNRDGDQGNREGGYGKYTNENTVQLTLHGGWDKCQGTLDHREAQEFGVDVWECHSNCFVRMDDYGNVFRGCYKGEYRVDPDKLGCHRQQGALWCFCEEDRCNTLDIDKQPEASETPAYGQR